MENKDIAKMIGLKLCEGYPGYFEPICPEFSTVRFSPIPNFLHSLDAHIKYTWPWLEKKGRVEVTFSKICEIDIFNKDSHDHYEGEGQTKAEQFSNAILEMG